MDTPDDGESRDENIVLTWLEQRPIEAKLTALALLYLTLVRPTEPLAHQIMREFLFDIENVAQNETASLTLEERTMVGYVLALRDALVGQDGSEIPPSATTRQEGGDHEA